jgi:oxygen-independent coproporphyrinogen-3 oxidase
VRPALGVYVHVPYCAARCGYCDFNTYVVPAAQRARYAAIAVAELRLAARALARRGAARAVDTVFFGGGTPTLLAPADLAAILRAVRDELGLAPVAEVTVEANPESVDIRSLTSLLEVGVGRVSLGVQSTAPAALAALDRAHTPGRGVAALREARDAGFAHVSADLIYGAPGETDEDWRRSLEDVLAAGVDHVSAYALTVERGTALHARVRRGVVPAPDDDVLADRYALADATLAAAGLRWYELSSWAATPDAACRHNLGYWRSQDWLAIGPGAHGHLAGTRWWNVRRPEEHARLVADGRLPVAGRETLGEDERATERVMLGLRLAEGLALEDERTRRDARALAADGLLARAALARGRAVLTLRGRLRADHVASALLAPARRRYATSSVSSL